MFGIIEAFVFCPNNINIPLLPYKDERNELLSFPRGRFIGVYFTEELIKARSVGYMVYPIRGYDKSVSCSLPMEYGECDTNALFHPVLFSFGISVSVNDSPQQLLVFGFPFVL